MRSERPRGGAARLVLATALLGCAAEAPAASAEEPLSVTYGPQASTGEGDPDFRETVYLEVPATTEGRLYLRVFDADTGGAHDLAYGSGWDTTVRYTVYGGRGAATAPVVAARETGGKARRKPSATSGAPDAVTGGTVLADRPIGEDAALDDAWETIASFTPDQGERVGDRYVFRLEVVGVAGDDGNAFEATLSLRDRRNVAPAGLEILDYAPTIRVPDDSRVTEVPFDIPADVDRIVVHNFDAANGRVAFASTYRTVELAASGQDEWRESEVVLTPEERGATASIVAAGGEESPNDLTLFVTDGAGRLLPMRLPARAWPGTDRPDAAASYAPLADCAAYAFDASRSTDPDGGRLAYRWDFGDGGGSEEATVVHRYPSPGVYGGALRVLGGSGRVGDGAEQPFRVQVKRPPSATAGPDVVAAPGEAVAFDGTGSRAGDRPIRSYEWDFQDGTKAYGPKPTHAFARSGRYLVTLRVRDDRPGVCDSSVAQVRVDVNAPPVAVAGPDRRVAVGEAVELDGRRSYDVDGTIAAWSWNFGDGTAAEGPTAEHRYVRPGAYLATLTVRDSAGLSNSTAAGTTRIVVNEPPVAVIGPDRKAAIGEVLAFDGGGSSDRDGKLVRYAWDFGDGATGEGAQVHYAYERPGTYRVTLSVTDDSGTSSGTSTATAQVAVNAPPVAQAGPGQVVTASEVRFDGSASSDPDGSIATYAWDFGDGTTGAGPRPAHVYAKPGLYRVRLTVTDDSGTERSSATDSLSVLVNQAPIADAGPDQVGAPGQELVFSGAGSLDPDGDVVEWLWDFGDGATAGGERVSHRFERPGRYHVRLRVRDDTGQPDAVAYDEAVAAINAPPVAKAGPDLLAAPGDKVVFDAGGSFDPDGRITAYRWDFDDLPEPAAGRVVTRAYAAPGLHSARLTVTDDSGAPNATAQDDVTVRINHQPVANAGHDLLSSSTTVELDGSASADGDGDALVYGWDFGDGSPPAGGAKVSHTYAEGGTYPVVLTVDDGTGLRNAKATAAVTVRIDRPPVADAGGNRAVCSGDVVVLDGSRSRDPEGGLLRYHWDFGDGTGADVVNPTKTYERGGSYPVSLTVEDDSGFPANRHTDRVLVRVDEGPVAVAGPPQTACAGAAVRFDGSGSRAPGGVISRFGWNFGDGSTGGGERPSHVFAKPGDYRVVLTATTDQSGRCPNSSSGETSVKVVEAPSVRIAAPDSVAVGAEAVLDGSGSTVASGRVTGWAWDFGDGTTAQGPVVRHAFARSGSYLATLTLSTEGGASACSSVSAQHAILANAAPVADAGGDRAVAIDEEVLFDGSRSRDEDGGIIAYAWDFGDGDTAGGVNARHRFRKGGRYAVKLAVTDNAGLPNSQATDTAVVAVNEPPVPVIAAPKAACPGESLALSAAASRDPDGTIAGYAWSFGDGQGTEGPEARHAYAAPGLYELTLTVDDGTGLANARTQATLPFRVNRAPRAEAGPESKVCPGQEVAFDGTASADWDGRITGYRWDFGDGAVAEGPRATHTFARPGTHDVRLTVTDDSRSSCAAATSVARVTVVRPPVARAGGDRAGFVGGAHDALLFDASASEAADGQPLSYSWDMGDGSALAGEKVRHGYAKPGLYPVRLTVSDGSGLACGSASDAVHVSVRRRD